MFSLDAINAFSIVLIFIEGLMSFFSPCVLPLLPVYMGYISGNIDIKDKHAQRKIFLLTLCFIVGIFIAIFLLNTSLTIFSSFFKEHMILLVRIGGIFIILLGIHQLGFIKFKSLEKTKRLQLKRKHDSSYVFAFLLGFTFSFSWTPCIGPALSSVLILANSSQSFLLSNALMFVYALGLTIPFLILGLFTKKALQWFQTHKEIVKYTVKIGAVILILIGVMMFKGTFNTISNYVSPSNVNVAEPKKDTKKNDTKKEKEAQAQTENQSIIFTLPDQHGNMINTRDLQGKVVFINFWATWCPPCRQEMPHIQELYDKYKNRDDVAILTIVRPGGQEQNKEGILAFLNENGYTMPVLFDDGQISNLFQIYSYPTTYMLNKDGTSYGYVKGGMTLEIMEQIIDKTLTQTK